MAQTVYECMFLFDPNAYARNPANAPTTVQELIEKSGGKLLASRLWNEQKLAYQVNGHRKGVYWLSYLELESTSIPQFNRACQLTDMIMRHLVIKIDPRLVEPMVAVATGQVDSGEGGTDESEKDSGDGPDSGPKDGDSPEPTESPTDTEAVAN